MIRVLGIQSDDYERAIYEKIIKYFSTKEFIQTDIETDGLSCYSNKMICFQIGDYNNQFVISPEWLPKFKELLETKTLIFQNGKFDLSFLYHQDIFPTKVWDTFLTESVLYCGIKTHKKGLADLSRRYLGIEIDKSIRENIWEKGLSKEVIEYSANDVKYLEQIKAAQEVELTKKDLHKCLELENQFVLCLAYIEYSGFKLDKAKWKAKMDNDYKNFKESEKKLNQFILDNKLKEYISVQGDLFSQEQKILINWQSPIQVIKLFKKLKIPTSVVDHGEEKDSVDAKHINKYQEQWPLVKDYLEYKEWQKVVSTYGQTFIDLINPISGRLHTSFRQIMDTGRISSGRKDKKLQIRTPNFQNISADSITRGAFVCEEGNVLVDSDYSAQEQVVLANSSLDPTLLKFYDDGLKDIHAFIASKMFWYLNDVSYEEIKEKYKDERQESKIAGFIISYGGSSNNIAEQLNKSKEDGERVFKAYFNAFPGLKAYFEERKQEGLRNGFIYIDKVYGRKSYIYGYEEYLQLKQEIDSSFWDKWRDIKTNKEHPSYQNMKDKIQKYFLVKGEIERKSLNFTTQGTAANITKQACINFFEWIRTNNLLKIVKIPNTVHDQIITECPKEIAEKVKEAQEKAMLDAAAIYCKRVPMKVETNITTYWKK